MAYEYFPFVEQKAQKLSFSYQKTSDGGTWSEVIGYVPLLPADLNAAEEAGYIASNNITIGATDLGLNTTLTEKLKEDYRSSSGAGNAGDELYQSAINYEEVMERARRFMEAVSSGLVQGTYLGLKASNNFEITAEEE